MVRRWILLMYCVLGLWPGGSMAQMRYIHPPPESVHDHRMDYYWRLLEAALHATEPTWGPYEVAPSKQEMNSDRAQLLLSKSDAVTVIARTTSVERENALRPLRIPLDKGLTGYRLFLIQKPLQSRTLRVKTLKDLQAFRIGQKSMWVDVEVLQRAGLNVVGSLDYESLFRMLPAGRFDMISRGINEIQLEWETHSASNPDLAIERHILLYYPLPRYYFFAPTPEGARLAQRVGEGLALLRTNHEFDRLYNAFKREVLSGIELQGRQLIRIPNPTLPPQTPLDNPTYWDTLRAELTGTSPTDAKGKRRLK